MAETKKAQTERAEATVELRKYIKPGDTLFTVLRHVSKSGMYRVIDVFRIVDGTPLRISWSVAKADGFRYDVKHEGVGVTGCGTDVGFEIVHNLGHYLFPDGFKCCGKDCPSADHSNDYHDNPPKAGESTAAWRKRLSRPSRLHKSGGYALRHRWL